MTHRKRKEKISKPISPIAIIARKIVARVSPLITASLCFSDIV